MKRHSLVPRLACGTVATITLACLHQSIHEHGCLRVHIMLLHTASSAPAVQLSAHLIERWLADCSSA